MPDPQHHEPSKDSRDAQFSELESGLSRMLLVSNRWLASHSKSKSKVPSIRAVRECAAVIHQMLQTRALLDLMQGRELSGPVLGHPLLMHPPAMPAPPEPDDAAPGATPAHSPAKTAPRRSQQPETAAAKTPAAEPPASAPVPFEAEALQAAQVAAGAIARMAQPADPADEDPEDARHVALALQSAARMSAGIIGHKQPSKRPSIVKKKQFNKKKR